MQHTAKDIELLKELNDKVVNCPKCQGSDPTCECIKNYRAYNALVQAAIPLKYRDASLSKIRIKDLKEPVDGIKLYIKNLDKNIMSGMGLYLSGGVGTGKTFTACCILKEAVYQGFSALFVTIEQYKAAIFDKDEDFIYKINNSDIILIDDYMREYNDQKGFIDTQVCELLRYRYDQGKSTLITSNVPAHQLDNLRIKSILAEMYTLLNFECMDYRKR